MIRGSHGRGNELSIRATPSGGIRLEITDPTDRVRRMGVTLDESAMKEYAFQMLRATLEAVAARREQDRAQEAMDRLVQDPPLRRPDKLNVEGMDAG